MKRQFILQKANSQGWVTIELFSDLGVAADSLISGDDSTRDARRIVDVNGLTVLAGRWPETSEPEIKPWWIVASIDKPGPVERGEKQYSRQTNERTAIDEARRLSLSCQGGRFCVGRVIPVFVTGWTEKRIPTSLDTEIPF